MELYRIIANWIGWPIIVAILLLAGSFIVVILNSHNALVKEENKKLKNQINELRPYSPDVLAERLSERLRLTNQELDILISDNRTNQMVIQNKEEELKNIKIQIAEFKDQISKAQDLLQLVTSSGLICPHCGAPLEIREYQDEEMEFNGQEIDINHEMVLYECGLKIIDNKVVANCSRKQK